MKVYISGPMTGKPGLNREAFENAEIYLKSKGYDPVNPHNIDFGPIPTDLTKENAWNFYMKKDLIELLSCNGIFYLEGWRYSKGAVIEIQLAYKLGIREVK